MGWVLSVACILVFLWGAAGDRCLSVHTVLLALDVCDFE